MRDVARVHRRDLPGVNGVTMSEEREKLVKISVYLEEEVLDELEALAKEYSHETEKRWSKGGVIRLALGEFFARRGKIL
ncbi:MAG: hypothetical protein ABSA46_09695 [Thermodesulfovibrionales bacterium]|jgi:hypothetical protein